MMDYYDPLDKTGRGHEYLRILLKMQLGERGWTFAQLVEDMRWHHRADPKWVARVRMLAEEMGLLKPGKPPRPAKPLPEPDEEPGIVPVPLRPPQPVAKVIKLSDRREPAAWTVDKEPVPVVPTSTPAPVERPPAPWTVDGESDDD